MNAHAMIYIFINYELLVIMFLIYKNLIFIIIFMPQILYYELDTLKPTVKSE